MPYNLALPRMKTGIQASSNQNPVPSAPLNSIVGFSQVLLTKNFSPTAICLAGLSQTFRKITQLHPDPYGEAVTELAEIPLDACDLGLPGIGVDAQKFL